MSNYTKGPWNKDISYIIGPDGGLICKIQEDGRFKDKREANAALIAACPEMLEALKTAELYLKHPDIQEMAFALPASNALRHVRAAIAKAEGRPDNG